MGKTQDDDPAVRHACRSEEPVAVQVAAWKTELSAMRCAVQIIDPSCSTPCPPLTEDKLK